AEKRPNIQVERRHLSGDDERLFYLLLGPLLAHGAEEFYTSVRAAPSEPPRPSAAPPLTAEKTRPDPEPNYHHSPRRRRNLQAKIQLVSGQTPA
ncbi:hypothetical protein M9458_033665, partial [Cirrhinus mrigala]